MTETTQVTQADREAAADYGAFRLFSGLASEGIREGRADNNDLVQAFARHRTQVLAGHRALVEADLDWLAVAKIAGEHGIRYRTNKALVQFLNAVAALKETDKP